MLTRSLALVAVLLFATKLRAATVTDSIEIESLFHTIETNYGPLEYKHRQIGLDWNKTKDNYRVLLQNAANTTEFYLTAARLLGELKDAHVHSELPTSFEAKLPLQFTHVEGKTVANYVSGKVVRLKTCPIAVGDELVSLDGQTPDDIRQKLGAVRGLGNARSDLAFLTRALTSRAEKNGLPVPAGTKPIAKLELRNANNQLYTCDIAWDVKGSRLVELKPSGSEYLNSTWGARTDKPLKTFIENLILLQNKLVLLQAPFPMDGLLAAKADKDEKGLKIDIGHKKPFYPMPKTYHEFEAPALMKTLISASGMQAGTFLHNGKTIGYLRIPDYVAGHPIFSQFALRYIMYRLEDEAQWLIIDQMNNPGGYVQFSDALVESLVGKIDTNRHMKFAVKPTQDFLRIYAEILSLLETSSDDDTLKIPAAFKAKYIPLLRREMDKVVNAYAANDNLSEPIDFYLMSELVTELVDTLLVRLISEEYPKISGLLKFAARQLLGIDPGKKYKFTKRVYMLTNELDFSGADATPAVLKDYDRVTLVGVNTAGAGGSVGMFSHHVKNPFKFSLTQSLMIRKGNALVENVGVKPDIGLEVSLTDIKTNYKGYFDRVLKAIDSQRP